MSIYDSLNEQQKKAVFHTEGPLLLLAGAGSGKTRVLTHRIAYLIDEQGVNPWNIMAITFTNKAAGEMRERVDKIVGFGSESIWVSTFHSSCVRILRRHIDKLGYSNNFTIYDSDDQKTTMKEVMKYLQIDAKQLPEKTIINEISKAKDEFIGPDEFLLNNQGDYRKTQIGQVYKEYQRKLKSNNSLDFDDLLFKTVELFQMNPDILEIYQERFKYIMVDEYQDTNGVQFLLIRQLARKYRNLCVVGDDDQSIYKFRGANIYNILNFEKEYNDATVIKLEQNYRSTQNILTVANEVIRNNKERKDKKLWTDNLEGDLVKFRQYDSEYDEALHVAAEIDRKLQNDGSSASDFAVLYRTNAQSRVIEEKLLYRNIPYKIVGGINFYARKEIKDLICYLKVIDNGHDDLAVRRIINVPKRGIGAATLEKVQDYANERQIDLLDALFEVDNIVTVGKAGSKIKEFTNLIYKLRDSNTGDLEKLFQNILDETGYWDELVAEHTEESQSRLENIDELRNKIVNYVENTDEPSLDELLEEIALVADIDNYDEEQNSVVLMTLHSAKGLEFPYVFLVGLEDGLFPGYMAVQAENPDEIEEERRLCYVGITRAKEKLYLSCARKRMLHGETRFSKVSRFVAEIPHELLETKTSHGRKKIDVVDKQIINPKSILNKNPYQSLNSTISKPLELDYGVGDKVKHIKFGKGTVQNIVSGGKDYEVTVEFEKVGIKKMFASFAKLKKVE